ncbi:SPOR domain-containing protein [Thalassospira tepidiphila]|nr:SPOR domain-containing protein [Thalassospira tepidiphila]
MKSRSATTKNNPGNKRGWITAAALLPLLAACSTDDLSGLWFGSSSTPQEITSASANQSSAAEKNNFDQVACGLFLGQTENQTRSQEGNSSGTSSPISLASSPQENLLQAISYDMDGNYQSARKLYVWLTATPPDTKVDLDCGQGIRLSGSINSLAQRRLVALDAASPEYARSEEIDTVVASATVPPGPELPDPPQVERDRRFYETGGVVTAEPEAPTNAVARMDIEVSENTAQLTRVERRTASTAPAASKATNDAKIKAEKPTQPPKNTNASTVAKIAPVAAPEPVTEAPTIAGDSASTEHSGAIVTSNARPVEQGELDVVDRRPEAPMIELPIASATPPSGATTETSQSMATEPNPPAQTTASTAPYYAVQLAAYRSRGRAEGAWSKFQNASHGMLAAADHEVVSIAIEGKGLFFRLLTGTYGTAAAATQACNTLKSAGTDCLVRKVSP